MHRKKYRALITPSLLLELASHSAMGVAVGLAFAFVVTHVAALGFATVIDRGLIPTTHLSMFIATCAATFGIGATLTGLVITLAESLGSNPSKK